MTKIAKIRRYWNKQAKLLKDKPTATTPDILARKLEIKNLLKYCRDNEKILDAGCGNGYSTIRLAKRKAADITGIDYSKKNDKIR